jgi:hypothetical protein
MDPCLVDGFSCDQVIAVTTALTAAATVGAVLVASWQLRKLNQQLRVQGRRERKWATLQACLRWDTDPLLNEYSHHVWVKANAGKDYGKLDDLDDKRKATVVLNYLDGIAIAVRQGMFLPEIVIAQFEFIIPKVVKHMLLGESDPSGIIGKCMADQAKYDNLLWLYRIMVAKGPPPYVSDWSTRGLLRSVRTMLTSRSRRDNY